MGWQGRITRPGKLARLQGLIGTNPILGAWRHRTNWLTQLELEEGAALVDERTQKYALTRDLSPSEVKRALDLLQWEYVLTREQ